MPNRRQGLCWTSNRDSGKGITGGTPCVSGQSWGLTLIEAEKTSERPSLVDGETVEAAGAPDLLQGRLVAAGRVVG